MPLLSPGGNQLCEPQPEMRLYRSPTADLAVTRILQSLDGPFGDRAACFLYARRKQKSLVNRFVNSRWSCHVLTRGLCLIRESRQESNLNFDARGTLASCASGYTTGPSD